MPEVCDSNKKVIRGTARVIKIEFEQKQLLKRIQHHNERCFHTITSKIIQFTSQSSTSVSHQTMFCMFIREKRARIPSLHVHREIKAVKIFYGPKTSKRIVKLSSYEQSMEIKFDIFE